MRRQPNYTKSGIATIISVNVILIITLIILFYRLIKLGPSTSALYIGLVIFSALGMSYAIKQIVRAVIQWRKLQK